MPQFNCHSDNWLNIECANCKYIIELRKKKNEMNWTPNEQWNKKKHKVFV